MNIKFLLLGTSLSLIPQYASAQCTTTPDCTSMGYKETTNKGGCLKCPTGNGWYCPPPKEEKAVLGECTGYAKNCKIADILNSDGTCTTDKENSKTPLGVVIAIKDNCGYTMTASPIETKSAWGLGDVTKLPSYKNWQDAIKDFNTKENTQKLIQVGNSTAQKAANYSPNTAPSTKGKWLLPSAGILNSLYTNLSTINNIISKLNGIQLINDNEHIWSSSMTAYGYTWLFCTGSGSDSGISWGTEQGGNEDTSIRPVLAF